MEDHREIENGFASEDRNEIDVLEDVIRDQGDYAMSSMVNQTSKSVIGKPGKKKMRCETPPKSVTAIDEMDRILLRHLSSSRVERPRHSSVDVEIFAARLQIRNAPIIVNDQDLYAPLFRNVSSFKRSY
ncbi:uncharacterized protein LOC120173464 [Hibiscus syriacus]|uniref:uncharacterized protein LOC120173464 n=1 Tax=Hibiscus syriacus TaxID=106335 RepID=UPI001920D8AB|nr:uncharacterized protein LOC120173464 [Hibiscus syriacus]